MKTRRGQVHAPVAGMEEIEQEMKHRAQYEAAVAPVAPIEIDVSAQAPAPIQVRTISLHSYLVSRGITNEVELDMMRAHAKGVTRATATGWAQIFANYK